MKASATPFLPRTDAETDGDSASQDCKTTTDAADLTNQATQRNEASAGEAPSGEGKEGKNKMVQPNASETGTATKQANPVPSDVALQTAKQAAANVSAARTEVTSLKNGTGGGLWRPKYTGKIKTFNEQKGYGFIESQETLRAFGRDVFVHKQQMLDSGVWVGQEVVFEVELNKSGQPQARRLEGQTQSVSGWDNSGMIGSNQSWNTPSEQFGVGSGYSAMTGGGCNDTNQYGMYADPYDYPNSHEAIDEMLKKCEGTNDLWDIVESYGHLFYTRHVVTVLWKLALSRQYNKADKNESLTSALVDRLVHVPANELSTEEAVKVLWSLSILEEAAKQDAPHNYAISIGRHCLKVYTDFSPSQMVNFISSLTRLVRKIEEDELAGEITLKFDKFAYGNGDTPRFPVEEMKIWTDFLESLSSPPGADLRQFPTGPFTGFGPFGRTAGTIPGGMPPTMRYNGKPSMMPPMPTMPSMMPGMLSPGKGMINPSMNPWVQQAAAANFANIANMANMMKGACGKGVGGPMHMQSPNSYPTSGKSQYNKTAGVKGPEKGKGGNSYMVR